MVEGWGCEGVVKQRLHQFKLSSVYVDKCLATEAQEGQKSSDLSHHDLSPLLQFPVYTRKHFVLVSLVGHSDTETSEPTELSA